MVRTLTAPRTPRVLLVAMLFIIGWFISAGPAQAADGSTVTISSQETILFAINMVVGVLLPLISQAITNTQASEPVKTVVNLAIAAIIGVVTPFATGQQSLSSINWLLLAMSVVQIWLLSIVSHYGLWKGIHVTGSTGSIANAIPGGIGAPSGSSDALITQSAPDVTNGEVANPTLTVEQSPAPVPSDTIPAVDPNTVLDSAPLAPANVVQDSGKDPSPDVAL